jgi:hypothetical protein
MPTAEVRWFFDGSIPAAIAQWFCRGSLLDKAAPREDHYMLFPSPLGLNIKLREGRLEVKSRVGAPGLHTFATNITGNVELWEKRIGGDAAVAEFEKLRASAPHLWIAVGKERTLRTFSLERVSIQEVAAGKIFLADGCNVELTKITVDRAAYWSFAFEAFGEPSRVEAHMQKIAERIFADSPTATFVADNSFSYPEWLDRTRRSGSAPGGR